MDGADAEPATTTTPGASPARSWGPPRSLTARSPRPSWTPRSSGPTPWSTAPSRSPARSRCRPTRSSATPCSSGSQAGGGGGRLPQAHGSGGAPAGRAPGYRHQTRGRDRRDAEALIRFGGTGALSGMTTNGPYLRDEQLRQRGERVTAPCRRDRGRLLRGGGRPPLGTPTPPLSPPGRCRRSPLRFHVFANGGVQIGASGGPAPRHRAGQPRRWHPERPGHRRPSSQTHLLRRLGEQPLADGLTGVELGADRLDLRRRRWAASPRARSAVRRARRLTPSRHLGPNVGRGRGTTITHTWPGLNITSAGQQSSAASPERGPFQLSAAAGGRRTWHQRRQHGASPRLHGGPGSLEWPGGSCVPPGHRQHHTWARRPAGGSPCSPPPGPSTPALRGQGGLRPARPGGLRARPCWRQTGWHFTYRPPVVRRDRPEERGEGRPRGADRPRTGAARQDARRDRARPPAEGLRPAVSRPQGRRPVRPGRPGQRHPAAATWPWSPAPCSTPCSASPTWRQRRPAHERGPGAGPPGRGGTRCASPPARWSRRWARSGRAIIESHGHDPAEGWEVVLQGATLRRKPPGPQRLLRGGVPMEPSPQLPAPLVEEQRDGRPPGDQEHGRWCPYCGADLSTSRCARSRRTRPCTPRPGGA